MEKSNITYGKLVKILLLELVEILYYKNYFTYYETSEEYVDKIYFEIDNHLPTQKHYLTPTRLARRGKYYAKIKGSKRTVWYVFFDKKDNRYFIENITNNHVASASFLNGLK